MTREEAIHRIKDHMVHHGIGRFPHILLAEAMKMAIAALREQEERSKGCEWCVSSAWMNNRFCPMCGRKLEVEG